MSGDAMVEVRPEKAIKYNMTDYGHWFLNIEHLARSLAIFSCNKKPPPPPPKKDALLVTF